jgi:beta-lactam-binding protein with PASTA domain
MLKIITHRPFWVNLLVALVLAFLLVYLFLKTLGCMTRHGEYLTVPAVTGKKTAEAIKFLESKGFNVEIQDSVYTDTASNGIVLKQLPDANSTVKVNRTVFLTVNRLVPPLIDMPKLVDLSTAFALDVLERNHLKLEDTVFKPSFNKGSVIEQQYNGSSILPGAKVRWGSKITLVIASGTGDEKIPVPDLIGMRLDEARAQLEAIGVLPIPVPYGPITDTAGSFVVKQNPPSIDENHAQQYIQSGQVMDLWFSAVNENPFDSTGDLKKPEKKQPKKGKTE